MAQILVISDSYNLRTSLAGVLRRANYYVKSGSPGDMPRLLNTQSYDLVILELRTPFESGLKLLSTIRSLYKLPVIILSSATYPDVKRQALLHGARDFLLEPTTPEVIIRCVQKILRRKNQLADNAKSDDYASPHYDSSS